MTSNPPEVVLKAIRDDGRYPPSVYEFLHAGLEYTTRKLFGAKKSSDPRHVTGQQLCEGLCDLALERWGFMAGTVLRYWNVRTTRDFGEMVYFLIDLGLMGRQPSDRIEDFDDVFDLDETFSGYAVPSVLTEG